MPVVAPPASAVVTSGTTDWIFANTYADGYSYDHPGNVLRRDGATAYAELGGGITLRDFAPVDLPLGAAIDKVELRFHMAGDHASAGLLQSFPTNRQCEDHNRPGYVKDFTPASVTTLDDYIVEYTDQDCQLLPDNVRRGQYDVWISRFTGTDAHFTIDDISVRFTYTARSVEVNGVNADVGAPVTASYICPAAPGYAVVQSNGQIADGVTFGAPVAGPGGAYTQEVRMANSGQYVLHVTCSGFDMPSPVITVTDPAESVTDWLFATTTADGASYDHPGNVLARDGVTAHSETGNGQVTLRNFPGVALPADATVRKIEIRSHLGGDRTTIAFTQYAPGYATCSDHNNPGYLLNFVPYSETAVADYTVNYTTLDCAIPAENVRDSTYEIAVAGFFGSSIFNIDDISIRFTYTAPSPATVAVSPAAAMAGTTFTVTYRCATAPAISVRTTAGDPAPGVTASPPASSDQLHYTQNLRLGTAGTYVVHLGCAGRDIASPNVTVYKPLTYVALGDSYSSGEGNPAYDLSAACHRSSSSWPVRVGAANAPRIAGTRNLACSGATTDALQHRFKGQSPQIAAMQTLRPDIVTVTIGGNDVDFAGVMRSCYVLRCNQQLDAEAVDINQLIQRLPSYYALIRSAAPTSAQVIVVGYPRLFPRTQGETHDCGWLEESERTKLNQLATQLDEGMASAARLAGVRYVSTLDVLNGHELCTSGSWVNPVRPFDSGAAHPNTNGQQAMATVVNTALGL